MGSPGVESVVGATLATLLSRTGGVPTLGAAAGGLAAIGATGVTGGLALIGATGGLALVAGGGYLAYNYFYPS